MKPSWLAEGVGMNDMKKGPWRITFDTNPDLCNIHCIMCEEHSEYSKLQFQRKQERRRQRLMPFDVIERVVSEAVQHGLKEIIPSTMGEPTLYKDFDRIVDLCRRHGIRMNLTTNGSFCGKKSASEWAELIVPVTSDVKFSWNGATKAVHEAVMKGSNWEQSLANLQAFLDFRQKHASDTGHYCRITLQLTFMEMNVAEIPDIVRLAARLGVDRVKGHHLWDHFTEIKDQSMRRDATSIRKWNAIVEQATEVANTCLKPDGTKVVLENVYPLDDSATENLIPDGECPFLGREAWVSAEGRFDPCCAPDEKRRTLGEFGNLNEQGFMEIWSGNRYRALQDGYQSIPLCKGCNMKRKPQETA